MKKLRKLSKAVYISPFQFCNPLAEREGERERERERDMVALLKLFSSCRVVVIVPCLSSSCCRGFVW